MTTAKSREARIRAKADRCGYRLSKSRTRDPQAVDYGKFALIMPETGGTVNPAIAGRCIHSWTITTSRTGSISCHDHQTAQFAQFLRWFSPIYPPCARSNDAAPSAAAADLTKPKASKALYARWLRHGSPLAGYRPSGAAQAWLSAHVDHAGDKCLIWPFGRRLRRTLCFIAPEAYPRIV
jgi:hypothetical protein